MLTVFVIISGENWNDVWSDTERAVGAQCAPFFVALVVLGNYVVLNLFVAILLGGCVQPVSICRSSAFLAVPPLPFPFCSPRGRSISNARVPQLLYD